MTLARSTAIANATTPYPSAEVMCGVLKMAEALLKSEHYFRLGAFFVALKKGSTAYKYGSYVSKYWAAFRGISNADLREIYEFTLLHLEKKLGPLQCHSLDKVQRDETTYWGYAEKFCVSCDRHFEGATRSWEHTRDRRAAAYKAGHPDRTSRQILGVMPNTSWRIATKKVAKAA